MSTRARRRVLFPALLAILLSTLPAVAAAHSLVDQWIAAFAHRIHGHEERALRRTVVGDIDGDGRRDVAVLFAVDGVRVPDDQLQFVAVFRRIRRGQLAYVAHHLVGGRGIRDVNRVVVLGRRVVLEALAYRPGDGLCCPSKPERLRYRLRNHELVLAPAAAHPQKRAARR